MLSPRPYRGAFTGFCRSLTRVPISHAAPVRSHELAPGHPAARAGRSETRCPKPGAHRRRRDHHAKALQFADDALITPPRVVSRETDNQRSDLTAESAGARLDAHTSTASPPSVDASEAASPV